jgi:prevent-host-death family protein
VLISVRNAKARLSELLERASRGEQIANAKRGKAIVLLVTVEDGRPRRPCVAKGRVTDAFFEPLPDDELAAPQAVRLLLDTQGPLWLLLDDARLPGAASKLIGDPDQDILVSARKGGSEAANKFDNGRKWVATSGVANSASLSRNARAYPRHGV